MLHPVLTLFLAISVVLVLAIALQRRFTAGYAEAPAGLAVLHKGDVAFIQAAAEVLFPDGAGLPVIGVDAHLPLYVDHHLSALPVAQRLQIRALLLAFEHLSLFLPAPAPGGRDRFSRLGPASRIAVLERVGSHWEPRVRILFTALRAVLAIGYLGHPANLRELGLAPFEIEPAVSDAELLFPRIGALPMSIRFEAGDRTDPVALGPLDPRGPRHRAYQRSSRDSR